MQIVSGFNHGTGGDNEKPLIKAAAEFTLDNFSNLVAHSLDSLGS